MPRDHVDHRYLLALSGVFVLYWAALAIAPFDRHDWLLENLLVFGVIVALLLGYRAYQPSRAAATLIALYLAVHQLGAHYTYAQVPYDEAWQALTGLSLNAELGWQRNQFDRFAHLAYGLLLAYPMREVLCRLGVRAGFWSYVLAVDVVLSTSAIYELIEWLGGEVLGAGLGRTFLALQNDPWDAQKDMALAFVGALTAMLITALVHAGRVWEQRAG